jgi:hypothetical protein
MKLTNKHGLPQTFINVIQRPTYSRGSSEISVTEILSPPQLVQLPSSLTALLSSLTTR